MGIECSMYCALRASPAKIGTWNSNALSGISFANFNLKFCVGTIDRISFERRPKKKRWPGGAGGFDENPDGISAEIQAGKKKKFLA